MPKTYSQQEFKEFERAVIFASDQIRKHCRNQKPVLWHSILVGAKLFEQRESVEIVIAGILHDLIEDTNCTAKEIEKEFGNKVRDLVIANTHDMSIKDYKVRWTKETEKLVRAGRDAMIIKISDQFENLPYYILAPSEKVKEEVIWKHKYIIEQFKNKIGNEPLYKEYVKKFNELTK